MDENATIVIPSKKLSQKKQILLIAGGITFAILFCIYFGLSYYYQNHFYIGTSINELNCNNKTPEDAENILKANLENYNLTIKGRNSKTEYITASDIHMSAILNTELIELKEDQNPFAWPISLLKKHSYTIEISLDYNEELLDTCIQQLSCMQDTNMIPYTNATLKYDSGNYSIVPEKEGTTLDKEKTTASIVSAIKDVKNSLYLEDAECYLNPTIVSTSDNIIQAAKTLNTYLKTNITYNILGHTETVDPATIQPWLGWNEDFEVHIDDKLVTSKVTEWANTYNTSGKSKTLNTSYGTPVTISQGDYGWKINVKDTKAEMVECIKIGQTISKAPVYSQKAATTDVSQDYGNTYVEINLGTQHLYYYKEGNLITESDFVSGKVTSGWATPVGIYSLKYKQSPAILRGADYRTPVNYWMPFNGGVGLHDANWRNKFGGNIYYNSGSHGCINLPPAIAKTIYQNISAGTAVIVYNLKVEKPTTTNDNALTPAEQASIDAEQIVTPEQTPEQTTTDDLSNTSDLTNLTVETPTPAPEQTIKPTPATPAATDNISTTN